MNEQQEGGQKSMRGSVTQDTYDVVILGGGIAGLTLALQLKKTRPSISILVAEKQKHPVPEAAHKVGESSVEIAGHYLRDVLGQEVHMKTQQLPKFGLRFFYTIDSNRDVTRRVELGHAIPPPSIVETYQIDRGRLENAFGNELLRQGITFLSNCKVQQIALQPEQEYHRLHLLLESNTIAVQARWVVDASGRSSLLKRQLGLAKKVPHAANATWFRINYPIDIDQWSDDPEWRGRITEGERRLSTNHLMGPGYWVWLIPLASDSISIGIVTDAKMHPFEEINRFERAMAWLHAHEPQCAQIIEQYRDRLQDFRVMKDYCHSCEQVYSDERWCLTGEAGVFLDPFYSPGSDMIAISNGLICDLINCALDGEDIEEKAAIHNRLLLLLNDSWRGTYEHQYPIMGNAQVMTAKVIWDTAIYWAVPALLYYHDKFRVFGDNPPIALNLLRFSIISEHIQNFLHEWNAIYNPVVSDIFVRYYDFAFMKSLHAGLTEDLPDNEFNTRLAANIRLVEQLGGQLVSTAIEICSACADQEAIQNQVQQWQAEPFLTELMAIYEQEQQTNPLNDGWITLGHRSQRELMKAGRQGKQEVA